MKADAMPVEARSMRSEEYAITVRRTWLLVHKPGTYTARLRERFGDSVTFSSKGYIFSRALKGNSFTLALTSKGARQILSAHPDGYDAFWKGGFSGVAGAGSLWVLERDKHRRERQLLSHAFHTQNYRGYGETIRMITREKTEEWRVGQEIRALDTTLSISMDVIMKIVFGARDDEASIEEGRKTLKKVWKTMHPLIVFFPALQKPWFPLWRRYARARDEFTRWALRHLAERRARNEESDDILGRMMTARYEDGGGMSDDDICSELITILLAGHETTATALAWALYDLGSHPPVLKKLREEIDALGPDPDPGLITKLPYLSAVCNETLRLHTLLPEIGRELAEPMNLLGRTIPAGNAVAVSIMSIHHDPELYPEPDRYIPERFLERTYSPFEFLPFGGGHRRCLGAGLSDYEMRIALAEIVTRWEFETKVIEQEIRHDIAMGPKHGVRLEIKARRGTGKKASGNPNVFQQAFTRAGEV
jgi:cytochrome P450